MNNNISAQPKRLMAVDILRGMTVMLMIMVNNGAGKEIFVTLQHAKWNGMTPCDLVFPFFLFIMGFSIFLSLKKSNFTWSAAIAKKIAKRTILLFAIGLLINWLGMASSGKATDIEHLRIWGVMQRLALCYCAVSIMAIAIPQRMFKMIAFALLAIYGVILVVGNGYAEDSAINCLAQADNWLFGSDHLYKKSPVDPEGFVSTISAIAHTMIGFICGKVATSSPALKTHADKALWLMVAGAMIGVCGWLLSFGLPLNKRIWSPSYVLATCGMAAMALGLIVYFVDMRSDHKQGKTMKMWVTLSVAFGMNPLFLYVASDVINIAFKVFGISDGAYQAALAIIGNGYWASVVYSVMFVAIHAIMAMWLWKKKIFIKL